MNYCSRLRYFTSSSQTKSPRRVIDTHFCDRAM
jgi:hypothetical protein